MGLESEEAAGPELHEPFADRTATAAEYSPALNAGGPAARSGKSAVSSAANVAFAAIILPFLLLCYYARPASDDFAFANSVISHGFAGAQPFVFNGWSGRYFSTFLMTLFSRPAVMNELGFQLGPLFVIVVLFVGLFMLSRAAFMGRLDTRESLGMSLALLATCATQVPSPSEAFYWLTGAFSYMLGGALFLILLALLLGSTGAGRAVSTGRYAACSLLAIAVAGSNETLLITASLVVGIGTALQLISRAPSRRIWMVTLVVLFLSGAVAVLAPGNAVRASTIHYKPLLLFSGYHSLLSALEFVPRWTFSPALLPSTIVVSACYYPHRHAFRAAFARYGKWLWLVPLCWLGIVATAFFPAFWATGSLPPQRATNSIYLFFLICWFPSFLVSVELMHGSRILEFASRHARTVLAIAIFLVCFVVTKNFRNAVSDLRGPAPMYATQLDRRVEYLKNLRGAPVVVPSLRALPPSIWFDDVTYDTKHWRNRHVAAFYNLKSIRRLPPAP